jgi:hypothetical protein
MSDTIPKIRCKKCGFVFEPDVRSNGAWPCPSCQKKNPNLKRHYRSVADLCIIGLIATLVFGAWDYKRTGSNLALAFSAGDAVLLLTTIVFVYKSKTPWADFSAKALIWTVFGLALLSNAVLPLVLAGAINIPYLAISGLIVFPYLFWLNWQASKCTYILSSPTGP